jgi:hypothetical protein
MVCSIQRIIDVYVRCKRNFPKLALGGRIT